MDPFAKGGEGAGDVMLATHQATTSAFSLNGFERNLFFENRDGESFRHLAAVSGLDSVLDSRSFAVGDLDRDGDLDVVTKNLQRRLLQYFRNDDSGGARRVFLDLEGSRSNRDAIGARIELTTNGRTQIAEVRSAHGFQSQSPREVFFGLGESDRIDRLVIRWPSGSDQSFENLAAGRYYSIHEQRGIVGETALESVRTGSLAASFESERPPADVDRQRIFRKSREAPSFELTDRRGDHAHANLVYAHPTLVSVVSTWLPGLDEHLSSLDAIRKAVPGLRVLLLVVTSTTLPPAPEDFAPFDDFSEMRVAECPFRLTIAYAGQPNVLFPSSFLVVESRIELDLIGKLRDDLAHDTIRKTLTRSTEADEEGHRQ